MTWYNRELSAKEIDNLYLAGFGKLKPLDKILLWLFPRQYPTLVLRKRVLS